MAYKISHLPFSTDLETKAVLKKLARARSALAELKGAADTIPNENILISTLSLQEAKDSSAIENIITTHDEIYRTDIMALQFASVAAKEVHRYASALRDGFETVKRTSIISNNDILQMQSMIEDNNAGFRKLPGTALKNEQTQEIVYTPPQHPDEIVELMNNLEAFINDDSLSDWDPLVKMAVIHHQFESIHPFYDGNGRTGRIINILYLVKQGLLKIPILYLSRYINKNKAEYYNLLQKVRTENAWQEWVMYMLEGVEQTALETIQQIHAIKQLMQKHKQKMRTELPGVYSQDILNNIFRHPYTKIEFIMSDLGVSRKTASKYLDELVKVGHLTRHKIWKENFYMNDDLFQLLLNGVNPS
jgi:Fic family protein